MTPALRQYHRRFWSVFLVVMPFLFVWSVMSLPQAHVQSVDRAPSPDPFPVVLEEKHLPGLTVALRGDSPDTIKQLDLRVLKPMEAPEALLYLRGQNQPSGPLGILLGKLSGTGSYRFALPVLNKNAPVGILVYDPFHNRVITNLIQPSPTSGTSHE